VLKYVEIGYVARAHGVGGELRVHCHYPESTALERCGAIRIGGIWHQVAGRRVTRGAYLLRLHGIDDRDTAAALRGKPVEVARADLGLEDGEVLLVDLVGCAVVTGDGKGLGEVSAIELGPQMRLVVHSDTEEWLVPVVNELIVEVDTEARRIVVDLPDGLPTTPLLQ
jgi:16S rRNA processing protein RimM